MYRLVSTIALLLSALAACGCERPQREQRPNIAVIVLDTARPDLLSVYGHPRPTSPFLETFASQGTRFDRAYSSSSWTLPAHASLFTGAAPDIHQANQRHRRVADSLPLLPEQLADAGYITAGFSGNMWVSELGGLARGFQHFENLNEGIYAPHTEKLAADRRGEPIPARSHYVAGRVLEWLAQERAADQPFFLFVNLVEPHLPYLPDWEAAQHFLPTRQARWDAIERYYPGASGSELLQRHYGRKQPLSADEWKTLTAMYEGALRLTDGLAGEIIAALDAVSDPDNTLVFVLSDHGENLGDHGHLTHILNLYDSNLRILCIARGPGIAVGAAEERVVHITDLYQTLLSAAEVEVPPNTRGVDLRGEIPADRVVNASLEYPSISLGLFPRAYHESGLLDAYRLRLRAAIGPRFKLIRSYDKLGRVVRNELYDIIADPGETRRLESDAVDAKALEKLTDALGGDRGGRDEQQRHALDALSAGERDALRALGYLADEEAGEVRDPSAGGSHTEP